jgi:hypothetical protein
MQRLNMNQGPMCILGRKKPTVQNLLTKSLYVTARTRTCRGSWRTATLATSAPRGPGGPACPGTTWTPTGIARLLTLSGRAAAACLTTQRGGPAVSTRTAWWRRRGIGSTRSAPYLSVRWTAPGTGDDVITTVVFTELNFPNRMSIH